MNNWSFSGNLGNNCEVKTTQSGKTICEFSVAVSSGYGDNKKTTWAKCVIFGARAEGQLPNFLVKGQSVAISGEMTLDQWEKEGVKNSMVKVVVNSLDLIGERKQEVQQPQQPGPQYQQAPPPQQAAPAQQQAPQTNYQQAPQQQPPSQNNFDDDIPY